MSDKPKVYFTKVLTPEKIVELYKLLKIDLPGNIGVKVHSGEHDNPNFIHPQFFKSIVDYVNGTIIETNTGGKKDGKFSKRTTTEMHKQLLSDHEWTKVFKKVQILDEEGPDEVIPIENGIILKQNIIGKFTRKFDSILVLSHFKGHGLGGYGGALKQLSIGFASSTGKNNLHSAGKNLDGEQFLTTMCGDKEFKESMADAAATVVNIFRGKMAYINVMMNISVDCDCMPNAKPPCMKDIGILASTDPVAIDQACLDLVYKSDDPGKEELIKVIKDKLGPHIIECAVKLGIGKNEYELINVD